MRWLLAALLFLGAAQAHASDISSTNWSEIAASNSAAPPNGWPPNMAPSQVEPTAREGMSAVKRWYNHINATKTSGGSANVHTLTYTVAPAAYVSGDCYTFIAGFTNSGATTLNVNGLGAKAVKVGSAALTGNEIKAGQVVIACYDGTNFQLTTGNFLVGLIAPVTTGAITQVLTGGGTGPTTWSTVTGPLTIGGGALAITIPNASFLGGDGTNFVGLTGTQATALLNNFTSGLKGLVPLSGGGTSNYLRADGSWSTPVGTGSGITQLHGDVNAGPGSGDQAATITANAVTNAKLATMTANTVKANVTGITADPQNAALPSCSDTGGNHLNYVSGTGFNCGTSSSTVVTKNEAIGWPAAIDPNNNIIVTLDQASTLVSLVGKVSTAVGATATMSVYKAPSGTACSAGTVLHSGSFNANGTAATNQTLTVTTTALSAGDSICLVTTNGSNWTSGTGIGGITARITTP